MLFVALFMSALLLLAAQGAMFRKQNRVLGLFVGCVGISLASIIFFASPPVILQAAFVFLVGVVCIGCGWRQSTFWWFAGGATALAYGLAAWWSWQEVNELQARFPYESMEQRLPVPQSSLLREPLSADTQAQLTQWEAQFEEELVQRGSFRTRTKSLEKLHEQTLQVFVNSPGFGEGRMRNPMRNQLMMEYRFDETPPIPQEGTQAPPLWSSGQLEALPEPPREPALAKLHREGVLDFINLKGFGYVKDRRHVAGYREHQFSKLPNDEVWKIQALDLIGLVVHERPVAYISKNLPRMDELKNAPKRQLDDFEALGLAALEKGEELFVRDLPGGRRMLGAVRSARQCVGCHGGERGDLLGAFSYTLKPSGP